MDAPAISTLREEESPPPPRSNKFRLQPLVKSAALSSASGRPNSEDEGDVDDDDEEDQLIDDNDDIQPVSAPPQLAGSKRKAPPKRKSRKSDMKPVEDTALPSGGPYLAPTMSWFEANPSEEAPASVPSGSEPPTKKKKTTAAHKPPAPKVPKVKPPPKLIKSTIPLLADDNMSEGFTGTAASSPVTVLNEGNSPEPEPEFPPVSLPVDDFNLMGTPVPVYPLPTKPFPVQPPTKIVSGFAPTPALDRTGRKVRHWRVANREIRGIGGGRWFARSWVGRQESELATPSRGADISALILPKLPSMSISAPVTRTPSKKGTKLSAATSRSSSVVPDAGSIRAPTKMRTVIQAPPYDESDRVQIPVVIS